MEAALETAPDARYVGFRKLRLKPPVLKWIQDGGPAKVWRDVIRFGHDALLEAMVAAMVARLSGSADAPRLSICPLQRKLSSPPTHGVSSFDTRYSPCLTYSADDGNEAREAGLSTDLVGVDREEMWSECLV